MSLVINNIKKNGCLPTKLLTSGQLVALKKTKIETTVMYGDNAVFLIVSYANIFWNLVQVCLCTNKTIVI